MGDNAKVFDSIEGLEALTSDQATAVNGGFSWSALAGGIAVGAVCALAAPEIATVAVVGTIVGAVGGFKAGG